MATLLEEFNQMKIKIASAQARGDTATLNRKIHIIDHEAERARKISGPHKTTRVTVDCRSEDARKKFQIAKEKFFDVAVDPGIAIDLMIRALEAPSKEQIAGWMKEGETESIPDWMKP